MCNIAGLKRLHGIKGPWPVPSMADPDAACSFSSKQASRLRAAFCRGMQLQRNTCVSAGMQGYKVEAFPGFEDDGGDAFRFDEKAEASKPSLHHCLDDGLPHSGAC